MAPTPLGRRLRPSGLMGVLARFGAGGEWVSRKTIQLHAGGSVIEVTRAAEVLVRAGRIERQWIDDQWHFRIAGGQRGRYAGWVERE